MGVKTSQSGITQARKPVYYSEEGKQAGFKAGMKHFFHSDSKLVERLLGEVASLEAGASHWGKLGHHLLAGKLLQKAAGKMKDAIQVSPKPSYSAKYLNLVSDAATQYAYEINIEQRGDPQTFARLSACWSIMAAGDRKGMLAASSTKIRAANLFGKIETGAPDYKIKIETMRLQRLVLEQLFEGEGNMEAALKTANNLSKLASSDAATQERIEKWSAKKFSEYDARKAATLAIVETAVVSTV